jgi:hypothetical protein
MIREECNSKENDCIPSGIASLLLSGSGMDKGWLEKLSTATYKASVAKKQAIFHIFRAPILFAMILSN